MHSSTRSICIGVVAIALSIVLGAALFTGGSVRVINDLDVSVTWGGQP